MIKRYVDIDTGEEFNRHEVEYPEPRRARRIRDKQRMKRRAQWVAKAIWSYRPADLPTAAKHADHLASCSCWGCGHQRYWHGPNMQEICAIEKTLDTTVGFRVK